MSQFQILNRLSDSIAFWFIRVFPPAKIHLDHRTAVGWNPQLQARGRSIDFANPEANVASWEVHRWMGLVP